MTMNPLPPQAYTKDTLTKAYLWLLNQNDSIKEIATTPDVLVTLFLKAQRNGDDSLDTPSIQNFKNELKSLAGMMGELEKPANGSSHYAANGSSSNGANGSAKQAANGSRGSTATMPPFSGAPSATSSSASAFSNSSTLNGVSMSATQSPTPPPSATFSTPPQQPHQAPPYPQQQHQQQPAYTPPSASQTHMSTPSQQTTYAQSSLPIEIIAQLDAKSRAMVGEVREQLNLGSDVEVLRLLISLGYKKARNLYS